MSNSLSACRFSRAAIHCDAGELEIRLTSTGSWKLHLRREPDSEWRLACSGDLDAGIPASEAPPRDDPIALGPLRIDPGARRAWVDGAELALAGLQFDLLSRLASEPTRVFTKEVLLRELWGYETLDKGRMVDSQASRLRVKLRKAGADGLVVNVWGVGYRLWSPPAAA